MRGLKRGAVALTLVAAVAAPLAHAGPARALTTSYECAQEVVTNWTTAQLANETIVVPVMASDIGAMAPAARAGYGGLLLFGSTAPTALPVVVARLQSMTPGHRQLMVMTDEEGGGVVRLTNLVGAFPWAQTMGKSLTPSQITAVGLRVGRAMVAAGLNVDLAPVLDVDGRAVEPGPADPDGLRSFSGNPYVAAAAGSAFMVGLERAGVTSVVKHFPGLGGATGNTDDGPARTQSWKTLQGTGLIPFEQAITAGASAVMLSNASVPGLTPLPASLSPVVVNYLRQSLGFSGLLVTDSLSAGAISARHLSVPAASVDALEAGADQVLFGTQATPAASLALASQVARAIVAAVADGALARAVLVDAAAHVVATRNACATPATTTTL